jgi:hypothetical protein
MDARHTRRMLLAAATLALIAGCATAPAVRVHTDPTVDFTQYRTFAFYSPLGTDRAGYQTIVSQHLKAAAQRELEARGLRLDEQAPQLLVNFNAALQQRVQVTSYPAPGFGYWGWGGYYGYRWGLYGGWPMYYNDVYTYQEGTVNVDLVDAARKQLVWEGLVVGTVTQKNLDNLQASLDEAVRLAFARFPVAPTAGAASAPAR